MKSTAIFVGKNVRRLGVANFPHNFSTENMYEFDKLKMRLTSGPWNTKFLQLYTLHIVTLAFELCEICCLN